MSIGQHTILSVFLCRSFTICCVVFLQQSWNDTALSSLVKGLPETLLRQYEYEDPIVRSGKHLMQSPFFKVSVAEIIEILR